MAGSASEGKMELEAKGRAAPGTNRPLAPIVAGGLRVVGALAAASTRFQTSRDAVPRPEVWVALLALRILPDVMPAQFDPIPDGPPRDGNCSSCYYSTLSSAAGKTVKRGLAFTRKALSASRMAWLFS